MNKTFYNSIKIVRVYMDIQMFIAFAVSAVSAVSVTSENKIYFFVEVENQTLIKHYECVIEYMQLICIRAVIKYKVTLK